jgi:hypothetical protein
VEPLNDATILGVLPPSVKDADKIFGFVSVVGLEICIELAPAEEINFIDLLSTYQ